MKLTELEPQFLKFHQDGENRTFHYVDTLEEADCMRLLCPKCFIQNNGPVGTHSLHLWFAGKYPGPEATSQHKGWHVSGDNYTNLTTTPSYLVVGGCEAHFFITNGEIILC